MVAVRHRPAQLLRPRSVGAVEGAADDPARGDAAAGADPRRCPGAGPAPPRPRRADRRLLHLPAHHPAADLGLRRLAGPGADLAGPALPHDHALPRPAAPPHDVRPGADGVADRGDVRPDRRPAAADVRRRRARRPAGRPRDRAVPRRARRCAAAGRLPGRAGRPGRGTDHPPRAGGGRGDRRAAGQLRRGVDHPGHRDRHRPRHRGRGRRRCSRRTPWSTGCRCSCSTRRRPRPPPTGDGMGLFYLAAAVVSCSGRSARCSGATGRWQHDHPRPLAALTPRTLDDHPRNRSLRSRFRGDPE